MFGDWRDSRKGCSKGGGAGSGVECSVSKSNASYITLPRCPNTHTHTGREIGEQEKGKWEEEEERRGEIQAATVSVTPLNPMHITITQH